MCIHLAIIQITKNDDFTFQNAVFKMNHGLMQRNNLVHS